MKGITLNNSEENTIEKYFKTPTNQFKDFEIIEDKIVFTNPETNKQKTEKLHFVKDEIVFLKEPFYLEKAQDGHSVKIAFNNFNSVAFSETEGKFVIGAKRAANTMLAEMARKKYRVSQVEVRNELVEVEKVGFWYAIYHFMPL